MSEIIDDLLLEIQPVNQNEVTSSSYSPIKKEIIDKTKQVLRKMIGINNIKIDHSRSILFHDCPESLGVMRDGGCYVLHELRVYEPDNAIFLIIPNNVYYKLIFSRPIC